MVLLWALLLDLYSLTSSCHSMNVLGKIFSPKPLVIPALKRFFCIPYTGQHGLQIRTQLHKLLPKAYPHISIRFVFRPTCRLSDFFPFKDRIPFAIRSHVVSMLWRIVCWSNTPTYTHANLRTYGSFVLNWKKAFSLTIVCCSDSPSSLQTYHF